jgi:hypothetical protein
MKLCRRWGREAGTRVARGTVRWSEPLEPPSLDTRSSCPWDSRSRWGVNSTLSHAGLSSSTRVVKIES